MITKPTQNPTICNRKDDRFKALSCVIITSCFHCVKPDFPKSGKTAKRKSMREKKRRGTETAIHWTKELASSQVHFLVSRISHPHLIKYGAYSLSMLNFNSSCDKKSMVLLNLPLNILGFLRVHERSKVLSSWWGISARLAVIKASSLVTVLRNEAANKSWPWRPYRALVTSAHVERIYMFPDYWNSSQIGPPFCLA